MHVFRSKLWQLFSHFVVLSYGCRSWGKHGVLISWLLSGFVSPTNKFLVLSQKYNKIDVLLSIKPFNLINLIAKNLQIALQIILSKQLDVRCLVKLKKKNAELNVKMFKLPQTENCIIKNFYLLQV